jgi:hypothetical protein
MKRLLFVSLLLPLAGCATGEAYRTTIVDAQGGKTVYEAKRTGAWFATEVKPLTANGDQLEIGKTRD